MGTKTLRHEFDGARKKFQPFKGWAARITGWPAGEGPTLAFGKWMPKLRDPHHGGYVELALEAGEVYLAGANSKEMSARDKATKFWVAGRADDGQLEPTELRGQDVRSLWMAERSIDPQAIAAAVVQLDALDATSGAAAAINALTMIDGALRACWIKGIPIARENTGWHVEAFKTWLDRCRAIQTHYPELAPLCDASERFFRIWNQVRVERKASMAAREGVS